MLAWFCTEVVFLFHVLWHCTTNSSTMIIDAKICFLLVFICACVPSASPAEGVISWTSTIVFKFEWTHSDLKVLIYFNIAAICLLMWVTSYNLNFTRYVRFDADLCTRRKGPIGLSYSFDILWFIPLGFILIDSPYESVCALLVQMCPNMHFLVVPLLHSVLNIRKIARISCVVGLSLHIFMISADPASHFVCLIVSYLLCMLISSKVPPWVILLLILLSICWLAYIKSSPYKICVQSELNVSLAQLQPQLILLFSFIPRSSW